MKEHVLMKQQTARKKVQRKRFILEDLLFLFSAVKLTEIVA